MRQPVIASVSEAIQSEKFIVFLDCHGAKAPRNDEKRGNNRRFFQIRFTWFK